MGVSCVKYSVFLFRCRSSSIPRERQKGKVLCCAWRQENRERNEEEGERQDEVIIRHLTSHAGLGDVVANLSSASLF
jgi:hypothetical protein